MNDDSASQGESDGESAASAKSVTGRINDPRAWLPRTEPARFRYENEPSPVPAPAGDLAGSIEQFAAVISRVSSQELSADARAALDELAATLARLLEESPGEPAAGLNQGLDEAAV